MKKIMNASEKAAVNKERYKLAQEGKLQMCICPVTGYRAANSPAPVVGPPVITCPSHGEGSDSWRWNRDTAVSLEEAYNA